MCSKKKKSIIQLCPQSLEPYVLPGAECWPTSLHWELSETPHMSISEFKYEDSVAFKRVEGLINPP